MCDLTNPIFTNEDKARKWLESRRWPDGPVCPFCGETQRVKSAPMKDKQGKPVKGWYHCNPCRKRFTVRVGTLYERSHIPLHKWLLATHLMCASKKGISAHQLYRMLGFGSYKTAWFMAHRIREGMRELHPTPGSMGGEGKTVEADETFIGGKVHNMHRGKRPTTRIGGSWGKEMVFSLVERGGRVRSVHTPSVSARTLRPILVTQLQKGTKLYTDDAGQYRHMRRDFDHEIVNHTIGEYVRGDAHTNTIENYFSILKRGIVGTFHHVSQQHLRRYLGEFDFRYNYRSVSDRERADEAVKGIEGKRLTYKGPHQAAHA